MVFYLIYLICPQNNVVNPKGLINVLWCAIETSIPFYAYEPKSDCAYEWMFLQMKGWLNLVFAYDN